MIREYIQLSELERKVITILAEQGPLSGYDFHLGGKRERGHRKAIMSSGSWFKVQKHLGPDGLNVIKQVGLPRHHSTDERGRRKDLYWLTDEGLKYAVLNDANLALLLKNLKKVYPNDVEQTLFVELATVDKELFKTAFALTLLKKPSEPDISTTLSFAILLLSKRIGKQGAIERLRKLRAILKKYPEYLVVFSKGLTVSEKEIKELKKELAL